MFMPTSWHEFVSCSVATITKMMTNDPLTGLSDMMGRPIVGKSCDPRRSANVLAGRAGRRSAPGTMCPSMVGPGACRVHPRSPPQRPGKSSPAGSRQGNRCRKRSSSDWGEMPKSSFPTCRQRPVDGVRVLIVVVVVRGRVTVGVAVRVGELGSALVRR